MSILNRAMKNGRSRDTLVAVQAALAGLVVAFALYGSTLGHPFLSDDATHIVTNPTIARLSATGLTRLWITPYLVGIRPDGSVIAFANDPNPYRPVTTASYWLNAAVTGVHPAAFRAANIMLHAAAAWLVGLLALRWCGPRAGAIAGAIVLLHPIATDVINRIVGRSDILVVVGMAGFLAAQRGAQRARWTWTRTLGAALAATVALGAKESGIALLPLAIVQAWLGRESAPRPGVSRSEPSSRSHRHPWRGALALAIPAMLYAAGRLEAVGFPRFTRSHYDLLESALAARPFAERLPASLALAWDYCRRLLVPWPLMALDYPERFPRWTDWTPWAGLAVLVTVTAITIVSLRRRHPLALGAAWWLASWLVVSHLLVATWTYRDVRLAYPMLAGAALALGVAFHARAARNVRATVFAAATLAIVAVVLVILRNAEMTSDLALAEADVRYRPLAASAQVKLGDMLDLAGRDDEAIRAYELASVLAPWSYQAWYQLGGWYERHGRRDDARRAYEHAAALDPTFPFAFVNLALLDLEAGDLAAAATHLAAAERADADDPHVQYNLAVLDSRRGMNAAARARLERLAARRPDFGPAVRALAQLGPR